MPIYRGYSLHLLHACFSLSLTFASSLFCWILSFFSLIHVELTCGFVEDTLSDGCREIIGSRVSFDDFVLRSLVFSVCFRPYLSFSNKDPNLRNDFVGFKVLHIVLFPMPFRRHSYVTYVCSFSTSTSSFSLPHLPNIFFLP